MGKEMRMMGEGNLEFLVRGGNGLNNLDFDPPKLSLTLKSQLKEFTDKETGIVI